MQLVGTISELFRNKTMYYPKKEKSQTPYKRLTWLFNGGRYWVRTSDPHRVKVMLSR